MDEQTNITPPPEWDSETKAGRRLAGAKLDAARQAVATLDGVVRWAAYEDEADKSLVVTTGPALKALGDGRIGGHLVIFGGEDLTGDFFDADTDYDLEDGQGKATVLYHHGMDATLKRRKLGRADLRVDDVGVWMEAQLALRDDYERALYGMIEAGKMGLSSGTAPHLVEREQQANGANKITRWPLGLDASITPIPAEPRTSVVALKTYLEMAEPHVKALLPQDAATKAASADATTGAPEPDTTPTESYEVKPTMTPEEIQALIEQTVKAYDAKLATEPAVNPAGVAVTKPAEVKDKPEAFKSFGEQLLAIAKATTPGGYVDRRLYAIKASVPSGMNESIGSEGGFLVQQDFATDLFSQAFGQSQLMQRCTPVPISGNANGTKIVLIDERDRGNGTRWGGIQMYWRAEAATVTKSAPTLREVNLDLKDMMGIAYATQQSLDDAAQLESLIGQAFAEEVVYKTEDALVNGTGAGQPLGVMNAGCLVSVAKETGQAADTLVWQNVVKMWARLHPRFKTNAVWLISPDVFPQMASMSLTVGTGGVPVYMPAGAASTAPYGTLFGRPVFEVEYAAKVGDKGDILLADWNQYYLASKGAARFNSSMHVRFLYDEMTYRMTYRVDGQPKFVSALTPANDGATLAAFVTLDAR
jgi:HK97 family phage major capsid protein